MSLRRLSGIWRLTQQRQIATYAACGCSSISPCANLPNTSADLIPMCVGKSARGSTELPFLRRWGRLSGLQPTTPTSLCVAQCSSSSNAGASKEEEVHIVQLPARSLWSTQYPLKQSVVASGEMDEMIGRVRHARHHYQYPSMCAPQIGWNVQMFTLFDGSVYINPINLDAQEWKAEAAAKGIPYVQYEESKLAELRQAKKTGFAWEPCASCGFLMHYIERPLTVRISAMDEFGKPVEKTLDAMRARMALHEMDHLEGVLFTRRVVDASHVVPLEGFATMSDWSDDYPSLEARSTFMYSIFTPPYNFASDPDVVDANLLDRKFEDGVYPGAEMDRRMRVESVVMEEHQRGLWRKTKETASNAELASTAGDCTNETEEDSPSDGSSKGESG